MFNKNTKIDEYFKIDLQNILLLAITSIKFIVLNWMRPN